MKHLLVDALSVSNLSGRHVLMGHLRELMQALSSEWRFTLLVHRDNLALAEQAPAGVKHLLADAGSSWWSRAWWGWRRMDALARRESVDLVFSPSGMPSPGCSLPQLVLAQNPWPLMPQARGPRLWLQRRGFARAQRNAWRMAFNSAYMRDLYRDAFGAPLQPPVVAWQGVDAARFQPADRHDAGPRPPHVLAVSVMARHKGIETLVEAFAEVVRTAPGTRLRLLGAWPEPGYRDDVLRLIERLQLGACVDLLGHVDEASLQDAYRNARVFCLLSRCESFGIPAVEAQAAGTPTVVAAGTAAPEIAGPGGLVVPQDDPAAAARALLSLLTDDAEWVRASSAARNNAERFRWPACSEPLVAALRTFAVEAGGA